MMQPDYAFEYTIIITRLDMHTNIDHYYMSRYTYE
jgi:hypothetical protein